MRKCKHCKVIKEIDEFPMRGSLRSYLCDNCLAVQNEIYKFRRAIRNRKNSKKNYALNTEKIKLQQKKYRQNLQSKIAKNLREKSYYQKIKNDPTFKLNRAMSFGIWRSLKSNKDGKSWLSLVDYTLDKLRQHLQNQFKAGMHWNNHGAIWHIDHIKPICSFNFDSVNDINFKECWSLSNLRPLFITENLQKSGQDKKLKFTKV